MKKLIAIFPDNAQIDVQNLINHAVEFRVETIGVNGAATPHPKTRTYVTGTSVPAVIMSHFTPEGVFNRDTAIGWVKANGYKDSSQSSALHALMKKGYLRNLGAGKFQYVKSFKEHQLQP